MQYEWQINEHNEVLVGEGFFISYNPDAGNDVEGQILAVIATLMSGEVYSHGGEETALVIEPDTYLILNGDFREAYEAAFPSLEACTKVFEDNIEHKSQWTSGEEEE